MITCGQPGDDQVVHVRVWKAVRTTVVLERGDDPALRFDRRKRRDPRVLQQLERRVVRRPGARPDCLQLLPMLLGQLGLARVVRLHRGVESLAMFSGKRFGDFPNEVSDLAVGG